MGINRDCAKFLFYSLKRNVSYRETLMLGRQQLFISKADLDSLPPEVQSNADAFTESGNFAEILFKKLGALGVDSMDYSQFEGATIIHDLNTPVSDSIKNKYSVVFDGGTLEHVFNFPIAIKNCMDMLKVGGHFISISPTNNYCGHGFYQFSPELFFALFDEKHGFDIKLVALGVEHSAGKMADWYEVKSPFELKRRVTLMNSYPSSLAIIAVKTKDTSTIELKPMQSDYEHIWTVYDSIDQNRQIQNENKWKHYYRVWTPSFIKMIVRRIMNRKLDRQEEVEGLGVVNPDFFTKLNF